MNPELSLATTRGEVASDASRVFDVDRIRDLLSDRVDFGAGGRLTQVTLERLWAGRHNRITLEYALHLDMDGRPAQQLLQAGFDEAIVGRASAGEAVCGRKWIQNLGLRLPELNLTFVSPDCDYTLAAIDKVVCGLANAEDETSAAMDIRRNMTSTDFDLVSYRANKRHVLRATTLGSRNQCEYVKTLRRPIARDTFVSWHRIARWLSSQSNGRFGLPKITAIDPDYRWYVIEGKEEGARTFGYDRRDSHEAARLLAALHSTPIRTGKCHRVVDELAILDRWDHAMRSMVRPHVTEIHALREQLNNAVRRMEPTPSVLLHRDFYASQLIAEGERTWLLDYDTFAAGDAEVDVATYAAHLILDQIVDGASRHSTSDVVSLFVDAYRGYGGTLDFARLDFYLASAVGRMAAVHGQRGLPAQKQHMLWACALEYAREAAKVNPQRPTKIRQVV